MLICELPPVATFSFSFSLSTPHFSLGQQNILRHDMIYMKCRLDAHFYYIFVAVSARLPPSVCPSYVSLPERVVL